MAYPTKYCSLLLLIVLICFCGCGTDTVKTFRRTITVPSDTLTIDNTKDTLVVGTKGTALFFPKDAFVFADGSSPKGNISIRLKECFSFPEMIRENLTTMSENQLLETRGMINVTAFSDNKELSIKQGKSFIVHFPKDTTERNKVMNLYLGQRDANENMQWKVDTQSILKPMARIVFSTWTNACANEGYFAFRNDTLINVYSFFDKTFDNKKLTLGDKLLNKDYLFSFTKLRNGDLTNKKVTEVAGNYYNTEPVKNQEIDQYIIQFFNTIPSLNPNHCAFYDQETEGTVRISFSCIPNYSSREDYTSLFNRKYSAFKNQKIQSVNDAELDFYIFSSSKLGWINCDYFWKSKEEKIDYMVKVDPQSKPNIKLVFKEARSIMAGTLEGDRYVFKNVPIDQEVKIVAIAFNGNKPQLSVSETKTSKQLFDQFQFRDFTVNDLEKQLNNP